MKPDGPPKSTRSERDSFVESQAKRDETRLNHSDGADLASCESAGCDRPDLEFLASDPPRLAVIEQTLSFSQVRIIGPT